MPASLSAIIHSCSILMPFFVSSAQISFPGAVGAPFRESHLSTCLFSSSGIRCAFFYSAGMASTCPPCQCARMRYLWVQFFPIYLHILIAIHLDLCRSFIHMKDE